MTKEGQNAIFALASSICRRQFVSVTVGLLDLKSLVEHDGEVLKVYRFQDIFGFVMYYVYVTSRPSLLIESTDSMINL